jgi:serine/threonine protein kinase
LGKGGFGRVYAAICQETNKRLAVKVVDTNREDDAEIQHIFEEIDTLRALSHRNIIQFISCGKDEDTVYVFMELMEGVSSSQEFLEIMISRGVYTRI